MTTDYPDWGTSGDRAAHIYTQGVPLARKSGALAFTTSTILPGHTTTVVNLSAIDQPSFHMVLDLAWLGAVPTIPFALVSFDWTDSASGFSFQSDTAVLPGGNGSADFYYIDGPARADQVLVSVLNLDPAAVLTYGVGMSQQSGLYPRFTVQETLVPAIPGFTRASSDNQCGIIGSTNDLINVSATNDRLCSTWGGEIKINVDNLAGTVGIQSSIIDPGIITGGSPLLGTAASGIIWSQTVGAGATSHDTFYAPYGSLVIRTKNTSGASTVQPTVTLARLEL